MILLLCLLATAPDTLWQNVTSGGVYSIVDIGDVTGDEVHDVVCGVNFWDDEPTLWCISGSDGSTVWNSDLYNGIYQDEGLKGVPDMNGDGYGDILMATPGGYAPPGRCLQLISGRDGSLIWQWSAYNSVPGGTGWGYCCDVLETDTLEGTPPDFLGGFGTTGGTNTGLIVRIDGMSGDTVWTTSAIDAVEDVLAVPDVTGDGVEEVYIGIGGNSYTDNTLKLLDGSDGSLIWYRHGGGDVMCVATVDRMDTVPWMVSCTFSGEVQCYNLGGDSLWARDIGGMLLDVEGGPDLNEDGIGEVAVAADNGGTLCLDGATGNTLWSYATGSNTWSIAWADSVYDDGAWVPCIVGGSVNGKKITLVNAETGELLWEQSFTERVYNVNTMYMETISPSAIVLTGLQDQQSQPYHAWAFLSSIETSCEENPQSPGFGHLAGSNPARSVLPMQIPGSGNWSYSVYDISGRLVWRDELNTPVSIDISGWQTGCYLIQAVQGETNITELITVLK